MQNQTPPPVTTSSFKTHANVHRLPDVTVREKLGSGRAVAILGEGGTAIVYQIWNEGLAIKRAVKLLKPTASRESYERFHQEMKILAQLSHPNIINVHSVGKWNGLPYIEMDYVDGPSLESLLEEKGKLPLVVTIAIAIEVARALDYTHRHRYRIDNIEYHGLLHRDLKPGNILLPLFDTLRLSDFGIATLSTVSTTSMTKTGKIIGSMQYLAPEQLEDKSVDHRSDIYSFGAMLYELVAGEKLFPERNVSKLVRMRVKNEIRPLSDHKVKIPVELEKLINKCISVNASERPSSMKKVLVTLEEVYAMFKERAPEEVISRYLNGESVGTKVKIRKKMKKKSSGFGLFLLGGTLALLLVLTLFISGLYWYGTHENPEFFTKVLSLFSEDAGSGNSRENHGTLAGEPVKVNVVVNKMSSTPKYRSKKSSTPIKKVGLVKRAIPDRLHKNADLEADTLSVLDKQLQEMRTQDTLFAFRELDRNNEFTKVIALFPYLSQQMRHTKIAQLIRHRAIIGLGQEQKTYYDNTHINDGEYYLSKGLFLFNKAQFQRAVWILRVAQTTPSAMMDKAELLETSLYYSALAETELYKMRPSDQRHDATMESWKKVATLLQKTPTSPYYKQAVLEIEKLSIEESE